MREIRSGPRLWLRSLATGQFQETRTYKWPVGSHDAVIGKITRGLYYHHFGTALSPTTRINVTYLVRFFSEIRELAMSPVFARSQIGGDDRFCYAFNRVPEEPELSIWIYQFYSRHWAVAVTRPEGYDFDAAPVDAEDDARAPL
jgi:hypothetical protein